MKVAVKRFDRHTKKEPIKELLKLSIYYGLDSDFVIIVLETKR